MIDFLSERNVAIEHNKQLSYPKKAPYNPSKLYPEYFFGEKFVTEDTENVVYNSIRKLLYSLGMDADNFGTSKWNPLKELIKPGDRVVIKPNFVIDKHSKGGSVYSVITHPSVIRAVVDYVYIALEGRGRIVIADSPQADADFENILQITKIGDIVELFRVYRNFAIEVYDLRQLRFIYDDGILRKDSRITLDGDPDGYTIFDIGSDSELETLDHLENIYGADYDRTETQKHHRIGIHEYCISNIVLNADVVISLPKMKTHRKSGVTLNFKNLVGINGNKNYLPHFRIGTPDDGGDEYPVLRKKEKTIVKTKRIMTDKLLVRTNKTKQRIFQFVLKTYKLLKPLLFRKLAETNNYMAGGWYGNDTVWRMVLDLNRILIYGNTYGRLQDKPQRKLFSIVDGIVAGEGDGPLVPEEKNSGLLAAGVNYLLVDLVLVWLMGFDYSKIPLYEKAATAKKLLFTEADIRNILVTLNGRRIVDLLESDEYNFYFKAAPGWKGHIERKL